MRGYFVGIGGQRCGTSWVADYLFSHPQVTPNPVKEMHVFDRWFAPYERRRTLRRHRQQLHQLTVLAEGDPTRRELVQGTLAARRSLLEIVEAPTPRESIERYRQYFTERRVRRQAFGEITPSYSLLTPSGFRRLGRVFPGGRMFLLLRDPVDRLWSAAKQDRRLDATVSASDRIRAALDDPRLLARSRFDRTLVALDESGVEPDRILVLFYEELFGPAHEAVLRRLTDHLGIDLLPGEPGRQVGSSPAVDVPAELAAEAARRLRPTYDAVEARLGRLPDAWRRHRPLADR